MKNKFHLTITSIIFLLATFLSCSKSDVTTNNNVDFFPPVAVNLQLNLTLAQNMILTIPGGWKYEFGGNKGIVICALPDNSFVAYDRTCSYNPKDTCSTCVVDSSNAFISCGTKALPCCGSKFSLANGFPLSAPARLPLKQYRVRKDGDMLYITN
jgi:nitrite reductase/ring-hydroxylating ferredoxin subunit